MKSQHRAAELEVLWAQFRWLFLLSSVILRSLVCILDANWTSEFCCNIDIIIYVKIHSVLEFVAALYEREASQVKVNY